MDRCGDQVPLSLEYDDNGVFLLRLEELLSVEEFYSSSYEDEAPSNGGRDGGSNVIDC